MKTMALACAVFFIISLCNYTQAQDNALFPVKKFGQWGYINSTGKLVIDCQFSDARNFHNGLAKVASLNAETNSTMWGYIDPSGNCDWGLRFSDASDFSHGVAWTRHIKSDSVYDCLYDSRGRWIIFEKKLNDWHINRLPDNEFINGVQIIQTNNSNLHSRLILLDTLNQLVALTREDYDMEADNIYASLQNIKAYEIPVEFEGNAEEGAGEGSPMHITSVNDSYIQVEILNSSWLFLNRAFDSVTTINNVKNLGRFGDGLIPASIDGPNGNPLFGYVDIKGSFKISPRFQRASAFSESRACVAVNERYGVIDTQGGFVVEPQHTKIGSFRDGLAIFETFSDPNNQYSDRKWGVLEKTGKIRIQAKYDEISDFKEGFAKVRLFNRTGFIDKNGKYIVKVLEMRSKGNKLIQTGYRDADHFSEGRARVQDDKGKWGFIDTTGQIKIKPQFDKVDNFKHGLAKYYEGEKTGYINRNGSIVWKATE